MRGAAGRSGQSTGAPARGASSEPPSASSSFLFFSFAAASVPAAASISAASLATCAASLRADLAAQPRSSEDALRDTELASLRAELASYKDAEQRASLLEETVASQAEEIRRLSEATQPADAAASSRDGGASVRF